MPDAPIDDHFIARLRRRDPAALREVVQKNLRPLYRAARGMGFDQDDAEDLAQEVLSTFVQTIDRFEGRSQVRTWLFGILHRKAHERWREARRTEPVDSIDAVFEARFDARGRWVRPPVDLDRLVTSQEIGAAIRNCLEGLPAAQREVFVLREMEELTSGEICKILGVTVTNLGVLFHRARARLRECLESRGWKRDP